MSASDGIIGGVMRDAHRRRLDGRTWDELDPRTSCTDISRDIRRGVLNAICNKNRYRLIVQTFLARDRSQSVSVQTRCLWNPDTDRLFSENYVVDGHVVCSSQVIVSRSLYNPGGGGGKNV